LRTFAQKQNRSQKPVSSSITRPNKATPGPAHREHPLPYLQRMIGNQAVLRMLRTHSEEHEAGLTAPAIPRSGHDFGRIPVHAPAAGVIQTKLAINKPGDEYEQEADHISEQVMRMAEPQLQGACGGGCPKCLTEQPGQEHKRLQTKRVGSNDLGRGVVPSIVDEVLRSPGESLDPETRANMGPRFGYDFSNVRVHTNEQAAKSARAVNALAFTVGHNIVFGAGQHAPFSSAGQKLLAHELAHVVQQGGDRPSHGGVGGPHVIARAPGGVITVQRKPKSPVEEEAEIDLRHFGSAKSLSDIQKPRSEAKKKHENDQRTVIALMDKARQIKPDPKKGLRDPDNLLRNTVQMFDAGRFSLTVLSPTHYSPLLHFDPSVKHPEIGGDYPLSQPKDPTSAGLISTSRPFTPLGKFEPGLSGVIGQIQSPPPKVEGNPGEASPKESPTPPKISTAPPTFSPFKKGDVYLFTQDLDVESQFRQVFVHEGQHVADLGTQRIAASSVDKTLEAYKSEFRSFWIQPPLVRTSEMPVADTSFVEATKKAGNSGQVTIDPLKTCRVCPPNDPSGKPFAEPKTAFKNERQEHIFWHIVRNYTDHGYDCCYVYNEQFHKEVNQFAYPESINLINSERLMKLDLELQNLKVSTTTFVVLLSQLEPLDWVFLSDTSLSKPFWDTLKAAAPESLYKGVKSLLPKGTKKPVPEDEVKKALSVK
jgi:Domain of unknown function (DUF4157)